MNQIKLVSIVRQRRRFRHFLWLFPVVASGATLIAICFNEGISDSDPLRACRDCTQGSSGWQPNNTPCEYYSHSAGDATYDCRFGTWVQVDSEGLISGTREKVTGHCQNGTCLADTTDDPEPFEHSPWIENLCSSQ